MTKSSDMQIQHVLFDEECRSFKENYQTLFWESKFDSFEICPPSHSYETLCSKILIE